MQISEFKDSLVYRVSSRTARAVLEKPCLEKTKQNMLFHHLFKIQLRVGEPAQWLRVLPALLQDLSLFHGHPSWLLELLFQGFQLLLVASVDSRYECGVQIYMEAKHIHIK